MPRSAPVYNDFPNNHHRADSMITIDTPAPDSGYFPTRYVSNPSGVSPVASTTLSHDNPYHNHYYYHDDQQQQRQQQQQHYCYHCPCHQDPTSTSMMNGFQQQRQDTAVQSPQSLTPLEPMIELSDDQDQDEEEYDEEEEEQEDEEEHQQHQQEEELKMDDVDDDHHTSPIIIRESIKTTPIFYAMKEETPSIRQYMARQHHEEHQEDEDENETKDFVQNNMNMSMSNHLSSCNSSSVHSSASCSSTKSPSTAAPKKKEKMIFALCDSTSLHNNDNSDNTDNDKDGTTPTAASELDVPASIISYIIETPRGGGSTAQRSRKSKRTSSSLSRPSRSSSSISTSTTTNAVKNCSFSSSSNTAAATTRNETYNACQSSTLKMTETGEREGESPPGTSSFSGANTNSQEHTGFDNSGCGGGYDFSCSSFSLSQPLQQQQASTSTTAAKIDNSPLLPPPYNNSQRHSHQHNRLTASNLLFRDATVNSMTIGNPNRKRATSASANSCSASVASSSQCSFPSTTSTSPKKVKVFVESRILQKRIMKEDLGDKTSDDEVAYEEYSK